MGQVKERHLNNIEANEELEHGQYTKEMEYSNYEDTGEYFKGIRVVIKPTSRTRAKDKGIRRPKVKEIR